MPTGFLSNSISNILRIMSREDYLLASIGLSRTKQLGFCYRKSEQSTAWECDTYHRVQLNRWISLEISQLQKSGKSKILTRWVGVQSTEKGNSPPETLKEVSIYASASPSQPGKIRNLLISIPAIAGSQTNADSSWGDWLGTWTNCSATCGGGVSITG